MSVHLYRRMCQDEAEKTLKEQKILPPNNDFADKRKWFTTTPFVSCWSHNPYFGSSTDILKITVTDDYFRKVLDKGSRLKSGFKETENPYVYVLVHEAIADLYNVGVTDLEELNREIIEISRLEGYYEEVLQDAVLRRDLKSIEQDWSELSPCEYFVQVPYDVAIMMVTYQTVLREAIYVKAIHFSKNLKYLERVNFGAGIVTLRVKFNHNIRNMAFFDDIQFCIKKNELSKLVPQVRSVGIYDIKDVKFTSSKEKFTNVGLTELIGGDNLPSMGAKLERRDIPKINFTDYEKITELLIRSDFHLEMVIPFIELLKDVSGIMQMDSIHIDSLKVFIEKSISISNLVVNYFSEMGIKYTKDELIRLKWELLLNSIGKPYSSRSSRYKYVQFIGYIEQFEEIVKNLFIDDFSFDLIIINRLVDADTLMEFKKVNKLRKKILSEIISYYNCSIEEALERLVSYVKIAFGCKISLAACLKPNRFYINLVNCLGFIKEWEDTLRGSYSVELGINYEDLYFDYREAYHRIVETYYLSEELTTKDMVWSVLETDLEDLIPIYEKMNRRFHNLDDEEQYDYDWIIGNYFRNPDTLVEKYFSDCSNDFSGHGFTHSERVGIFSYLLGKLADLSDEDIEILLKASKNHDIGRVDDSKEDTGHGFNSVLIAKQLGLFSGAKNIRYINFLMESHSLGDDKKDACIRNYNLSPYRATILYDIFKDADALDRVRYDSLTSHYSALKIPYLRTENARKLVKFAYLLNARYKLDKRELNPSIKKFFLEPKE